MWLAWSPAAAGGPVTVERAVYLMGTRATLVVEAADRAHALERLEALLRVLEQTEAELSTWRDDSLLSELNRRPVGAPLTLSPFLCRLWPKLVETYEQTDGAFDPTIGAWVEAWGLRTGGREPTAAERRITPPRTGLHLVRFDERRCTATREAPVSFDAGAFGKGAALGRLPDAAAGEAWLIDLGGQVAGSGPSHNGPWTVALARPDRRSAPALEVPLHGGSLATSGSSERSWEVNGRRVTHILDPRTGTPVVRAETVTVWHTDPLVADVLSTALYVMGADAGLTYATERDLAAVFLIPTPDGGPVRIRATPAFRRRFGITPVP